MRYSLTFVYTKITANKFSKIFRKSLTSAFKLRKLESGIRSTLLGKDEIGKMKDEMEISFLYKRVLRENEIANTCWNKRRN